MTRRVKRAAVLGSGVMGSSIAAHLANAGIPSLVLDIVPRELSDDERQAGLTLASPGVRNRIADQHVNALLKMKPAPLFAPWRRRLIETGNLEDDLPRIADADWVIEVVKEDPRIKEQVLSAAARHVNSRAVLSSNTSGLSLSAMARALPQALQSRFLGTHFFNPPRYMRLLELIPTEQTSAEVLASISSVARDILGKGIVTAKDTPNFVANRIGVHAMMATLRAMRESGLGIEELDLLTGRPLGRPNSGTFRLADMVGLDTLALVAGNLLRHAEGDECRELFEPPAFLQRMIDAGLLGAKTGAGFYKKLAGPERKLLTLDLETLEYRDSVRPELPELAPLARIDEPGPRITALLEGDGPLARAAWRILGSTLSYSAMRLGEICDAADSIDRAMRLGFNWELGPFETWDALGFRKTTDRLRRDDYPLPAWVDRLYESGATDLYRQEGLRRVGPSAQPGRVDGDPKAVDCAALHLAGRRLGGNASASLLDLGDEVLGLEFHSKMNTIDEGTIEMIEAAVERAESHHAALVLANDGENFCAGANLMLVVEAARSKDFAVIERIIRAFQRACSRLAACGVPVVVAAHQRALGGGCEIALAAGTRRPAAETYMGLVEIGAGLVPAGGGCLRLYRNNLARLGDPYPALRATFETIGQAKVSQSAEEARELGFLQPHESWTMNREHVIHDARELALAQVRAGVDAPAAGELIPVLGRSGLALIESALVNMHEGGYISDHDRKIGRELGSILCGGDISGPTRVPEQRFLDLERESFLRLCGEPKSVERMLSLLKTGRPLRN